METITKKQPKLSEIKECITNILDNLAQLEDLSNVKQSDFDVGQAEELQRLTTTLLGALDQVDTHKVAGKTKHKKRRHRLEKQRKKQRRLEAKKSKDLKIFDQIKIEPVSTRKTNKPAEHIFLKKRQDAATILQTFNLLEKLCESRGGDKAALTQKLSHMRHVWKQVQQECESDSTHSAKKEYSIDAQWDMVLFGAGSQQGRQNKNAFLKNRIIWDSYVSQRKGASCIPRGWVLPPENPQHPWMQYRTN
ncbi:hypothetical protein KR074_009530 [Drosophila pseudoananassae]|nr:hypothetical protein KR074_009530 [Drosophila pseudoananassae]